MLVLLTMMVPFQVMMIPLFLESNLLGLLDTYGGLILPKATSAFGIFMMRSYFAALPKDLEEAARVDGMSEFGIFAKIMFPLVIPGVLTLAIFHPVSYTHLDVYKRQSISVTVTISMWMA